MQSDVVLDPHLRPFLWSPSNGPHVAPGDRTRQQEGLEQLFCSLGNHELAVHFQDYLGQSVSFEFPFHYNYTGQMECEADTLETYAMLKR